MTTEHQRDEALRACPFCGCNAITFKTYNDEPKRHKIKCEDCPGGADFYSSTREQAIAAWNRRTLAQLAQQPAPKCPRHGIYLCVSCMRSQPAAPVQAGEVRCAGTGAKAGCGGVGGVSGNVCPKCGGMLLSQAALAVADELAVTWAAPVQAEADEPTAYQWRCRVGLGRWGVWHDSRKDVAEEMLSRNGKEEGMEFEARAIFAQSLLAASAPTQPAAEGAERQAVGLTREEIEDLWQGQHFHVTDIASAVDFVRDVEARLGIAPSELGEGA